MLKPCEARASGPTGDGVLYPSMLGFAIARATEGSEALYICQIDFARAFDSIRH